jgi:metallophosphoesterase (TIGR00282 family)
MKIFCIGDIMGSHGRDMLRGYLDDLIYSKGIDLVAANAENAAHGRGMSVPVYEELCALGVDVFTMGNHTWNCRDIVKLLDTETNIARPANYEGRCPGSGCASVRAKNGAYVSFINVIGRTYMEPCASPFEAAVREIEKCRSDIILVDFHAEATSEKIAMGRYLDGRVSAVYGTHTHVQTADEAILPKGTGYITDLGMTGASNSVLGMDTSLVINRFLNGMPHRFELGVGKNALCGCIFEIDDKTAKTTRIERINIKE